MVKCTESYSTFSSFYTSCPCFLIVITGRSFEKICALIGFLTIILFFATVESYYQWGLPKSVLALHNLRLALYCKSRFVLAPCWDYSMCSLPDKYMLVTGSPLICFNFLKLHSQYSLIPWYVCIGFERNLYFHTSNGKEKIRFQILKLLSS